MDKGFAAYFACTDADYIALQETKVNAPLTALNRPGYYCEWNCGERLGYSGTVSIYKNKPLAITHSIGDARLDKEGRLITLEYTDFYFVNVYVPNSQGELERWYYRLDWDSAFLVYLENLQNRKPVIVGGDFNVARDYIDIYPENLRNNKNPHGFLSEEWDGLNAILDIGFVDVFRELNPTLEGAYTWWSNRLNKRKENRGWRIDYFLISENLFPKIKSCEIRTDIYGSDHAPIELVIAL
jgi:exodeoxyribonuclease-3